MQIKGKAAVVVAFGDMVTCWVIYVKTCQEISKGLTQDTTSCLLQNNNLEDIRTTGESLCFLFQDRTKVVNE